MIQTSAEFGTTPDGYGNHTLANGNVAVLQVEGAVNVRQFGAVGDGVTDDTVSLRTAWSYGGSSNLEVQHTSGKYLVTELISIDVGSGNSIVLTGSFSDLCEIKLNTGGDGVHLNITGSWWGEFSSVSGAGVKLSGIRFTSNNVHTGVGVKIIGDSVQGRPRVPIILDELQFSSNAGISQAWSTATEIVDAGMVSISACKWVMGNGSLGDGLYIRGTEQATSPVHFKIVNCEFTYGDRQVRIGNYVEGVYITNTTLIAANYGVHFHPIAGESGLHVSNSHIASKVSCISVNNVFDVNITGNLLYRSTNTVAHEAINMFLSGRVSITGNVFKGNNDSTFSETAIKLDNFIAGSLEGSIISGNSFHSYASRAIWLTSTANAIMVGTNSYRNCNVWVLNQSASKSITVAPSFKTTRIVSLVGGNTTETFTIPIPEGVFRIKPESGFINGSGSNSMLIGTYNEAVSTATLASFTVRLTNGGIIPAGANRVSVHLFNSDNSTF